MKKLFKQNWFKLGVMALIVIVIFSYAYYLGLKNKARPESSNSKMVELTKDETETEKSEFNQNENKEKYKLIFKNFPSPNSLYEGEIAKLNFKSHSNVSLFKTRLEEGLAGGVNFSSSFIVVTWGCGSSCQQLAIINARDGNVYFPFDSLQDYKQGNGSIIGAEDISYSIDSNLLIVRPLSMPEGYNNNSGDNSRITETKYYLWEYNRFVEIKEDRIGMLLYDKIEETKKLLERD